MSGKLEAMSDTVQIEDALSVEAQKRQPLYAGRVQIYPKRVSGFFRRLKWAKKWRKRQIKLDPCLPARRAVDGGVSRL